MDHFIKTLAEELEKRHWDVDPDGDGSGIRDLAAAVAAALAVQQPKAVDGSWDELEIIVKGYLDDPHADAEYVLRKIAALAAQHGGEK